MQSEPETIKNEEDSQVLAANRYRLLVFIANHTTPLYGTIRSYVARLGLAPGIDTASVELEVMQEMVVEVLSHTGSFDSARQPMAWLLGIALNVMRRRRSQEARRYRVAHFMQMLAAVLVVGLLLSGFLLLSGRHPRPAGPSTGEADKTASIVAVNSSDGTVYGLRARDGAILWHSATGLVDHSLASDSSLSILNNVVYFVARGRVFALQASNGTLLWHQDVLPASTHVFGSTTSRAMSTMSR